ncbi:hypothetical protein GE061_013136 [Apolygus lucorum]|uniref:Uncharacterized protein n=1 Tax=Apolygus lucorum TaxID=248454 RepID=A0A6A4K235_APOLU|nr:hypothetical protein GE061_013136 [Apolygus lucorum]
MDFQSSNKFFFDEKAPTSCGDSSIKSGSSPEDGVPELVNSNSFKTLNTPSQLFVHRLKKIPVKLEENDDANPDFLYLMSLMPYINGMTAVQKLLLRAEFSAAVMKILSKKCPSEELEKEAN